MTDTNRVHVFSCGFEFECWTEANCDRCVRFEVDCPLVEGLVDAFIHGTFDPATAQRMGYREELSATLGWPCAERRLIGEEPPPAAVEMQKAGAVPLPGFES